ncbi:MAG TPA: MBL fold metallo-hydrolase, partial [Candidatus Limnocylindrales bacterium]|nr:MBL fold metallo-hydrolase [Candidatus Limnocylindrales bacterium]
MSAGVTVRYIGHATVLLELDGVRIITDPFLRDRLGPLERHGPMPDPATIGPVDLVLVSHGHPDHFDRDSLAVLEGQPTVIVPSGLGRTVRRWSSGEVVELRAGQATEAHGIPVHATRAKHWIAPGAPRAQPLGFVVGD